MADILQTFSSSFAWQKKIVYLIEISLKFVPIGSNENN